MDELAEIDVEVMMQGNHSMLVTNGVTEFWILYKLIDDESEIHEKTTVGVTGTLVIPERKAIEEGLI